MTDSDQHDPLLAFRKGDPFKPKVVSPEEHAVGYDFVQLGEKIADAMIRAAEDLVAQANELLEQTKQEAEQVRSNVADKNQELAQMNQRLKAFGQELLEASRKFNGR